MYPNFQIPLDVQVFKRKYKIALSQKWERASLTPITACIYLKANHIQHYTQVADIFMKMKY